MKKFFFILAVFFICSLLFTDVQARCAMCTKTAQQLGEKPALGLNKAILYLMGAPFAIVGFIGFRWWRQNKKFEEQEQKS